MNRRPSRRPFGAGVCPGEDPAMRLVSSSPTAASVEHAAAIVAALEQFMRDTAPTPAPSPPAGQSPWARAALLEGAGYAPGEPTRWG